MLSWLNKKSIVNVDAFSDAVVDFSLYHFGKEAPNASRGGGEPRRRRAEGEAI